MFRWWIAWRERRIRTALALIIARKWQEFLAATPFAEETPLYRLMHAFLLPATIYIMRHHPKVWKTNRPPLMEIFLGGVYLAGTHSEREWIEAADALGKEMALEAIIEQVRAEEYPSQRP